MTVDNEDNCSYESVVLYSNHGNPYTVNRKIMPRIVDQIVDAVIYLYPSRRDAEEARLGGGTGFLVSVESAVNKNHLHIYAVTNKHVINNGGLVVRINRHDGSTEIIEFDYLDWERHADSDVAIAQIGQMDESIIRFRCIRSNQLITKDIAKRLDIGLGDDVYMVGRFAPHAGKTTNMPSVRSGIISALPNPNEKVNTQIGDLEAFLVEMRSISGFSGSPVIFDVPFDVMLILEVLGKIINSQVDKNGNPPSPEMMISIKSRRNRSLEDAMGLQLNNWLIGIDAGNFPRLENVYEIKRIQDFTIKDETNYKAENHSGFSIVIPAWKILDLLNSDRFDMERKKRDKELEEELISNLTG